MATLNVKLHRGCGWVGKTQWVWGVVLPAASGFHWGVLERVPVDKGDDCDFIVVSQGRDLPL